MKKNKKFHQLTFFRGSIKDLEKNLNCYFKITEY